MPATVLFVATDVAVQVVEGQITWFVHMIGAIIKGRLTTGSTESQEVMDGELAARVLSLLKAADSQFHLARYGDTSRQRLDIALLTFFQHFRKVRPAPQRPSGLCRPCYGHQQTAMPDVCPFSRKLGLEFAASRATGDLVCLCTATNEARCRACAGLLAQPSPGFCLLMPTAHA